MSLNPFQERAIRSDLVAIVGASLNIVLPDIPIDPSLTMVSQVFSADSELF